MDVCNSQKTVQEKGDVRILGEARKLPSPVFTHVNHHADSCALEQPKELFSSFLREPDCVNIGMHLDATSARPGGDQLEKRISLPETLKPFQ